MSENETTKKISPFDHFGPEDISGILRKRLPVILITAVLISSVVFAVVHFLPEMYKSDTLILIDPQKVPEKYVSATVSLDVAGRLSTIRQEIMSSTRLQKLIETNDLYRELKGSKTQEEIIERMRTDVKVEVVQSMQVRAPGAFRITYQGRNPNVVAQVCNQLASEFINENLKVREQQASGTSEFIETQLIEAKKRLEETEDKLREFKLQHVGELPEQSAANVGTLGRLQAQLQAETDGLNRAASSEVWLRTVLDQFQAQRQGAVPLGDPNAAIADQTAAGSVAPVPGPAFRPLSEKLVRLRQERSQLEDRLAQAMNRWKEDHPDIRSFRALLKTMNGQIAAEEAVLAQMPAPVAMPRADAPPAAKAGPARAGDQPSNAEMNARIQLQAVQTEIERRKKEQERILGQIKIYQAKLDNMPIREQEIATVMRDHEMLKAQYQSLTEKKMSADMASDLETRMKSERFEQIDPPRVPEKPFQPNRPALNAIGVAVALAIGLALAMLLELLDDSIRKEQELEDLGLRTLARVPLIQSEHQRSAHRRRVIRNWALGTVATIIATGALSAAAAYITRKFVT